MVAKVKYGALNIPESLIEELKVWKMVYSMSYAEMIHIILEE